MPDIQTEAQLIERMGGPQEAQIEMQDLIHTMFSLVDPTNLSGLLTQLDFSVLPTADPEVDGAIWLNNGVLTLSVGAP